MKLLLLITSLNVLTTFCVGANDKDVLTGVDRLHIERSLVKSENVQDLNEYILSTAVPGPNDGFHTNLLGTNGDGGSNGGEA